jgi:transposase InsO family protein
MAERMVPMQVRLAISTFDLVDRGELTVSEACVDLEISRDTFYRYRARFAAEGVPGLLSRSSRPHASPGQTPVAVEELIVQTRIDLIGEGWDAGARSIHARLQRQGVSGLPTWRTVHRVLVRAGVVEAQPAKRPRSSFNRFEYDHPNGCWQIDGTGWHLAEGTWVCILRVQDDHSRLILATRAAAAETTAEAWACVETAIERHGRPVMLLSDGGAAFTQRRRGPKSGLSEFEARLRALGINPVVSSPHHPQTCGKKERDWQPLKRWLAAQQTAKTLEELQRQLDAYDVLFNTRRPHQGIGGATPAERYAATEKAPAPTNPLPGPCEITERKVAIRGHVELGGGYVTVIGAAWSGATVTVIREGLDVVILHESTTILRLRIDPTHRYQRSGLPRTPRGARVVSERS